MVNELINILGQENVLENESMQAHTTLKIGGPARYFVLVENEEKLIQLLEFLDSKKKPYFILGNGSNLLVSDRGYNGVIIKLDGDFKDIKCIISEGGNTFDNTAVISAGAASMLSQISHIALDNSLAGMEFAAGIPGTLGGAILMNAGAYGGEMKNVVSSVRILEKSLNGQYVVREYSKSNMKFGYRTSIVKTNGGIVLSASMELGSGDYEEIKSTVEDYNAQRRDKQPLEFPSAGSTFKRPMGQFAGKLITDAGLKGFKVGDAMVSTKHAGFCINAGNATAADFKSLMDQVTRKVFLSSGIKLEPEVILLGEF